MGKHFRILSNRVACHGLHSERSCDWLVRIKGRSNSRIREVSLKVISVIRMENLVVAVEVLKMSVPVYREF